MKGDTMEKAESSSDSHADEDQEHKDFEGETASQAEEPSAQKEDLSISSDSSEAKNEEPQETAVTQVEDVENSTTDSGKPQIKKNHLIAIICVAAALLVAALVFLVFIPASESSKRVSEAEIAINSIGAVTLESEETLNKAKESYESLSPEEQLKVTNKNDLISAQEKFASLQTQKAEQEKADAIAKREEQLQEIRDHAVGWNRVEISDSWTYPPTETPTVDVTLFSAKSNSGNMRWQKSNGEIISQEETENEYKATAEELATKLDSKVKYTLRYSDGEAILQVKSSNYDE